MYYYPTVQDIYEYIPSQLDHFSWQQSACFIVTLLISLAKLFL